MEEYKRVNQCIELLKETHLPTIKKLRVEIQLIQMKRLLLADEVPTESRCGSCGQPLFDGLMDQMGKICGGNFDGETLTEQVERLSWLLTAVGNRQATKCPPVPVQAFPAHLSATA